MKTIAVIGAGNVGVHVVSQAIARGVRGRYLLVDLNEELEAVQVLDLKDTLMQGVGCSVEGADFGDETLQKADIVMITAGASQKPGDSRTDLLGKNQRVLRSIAKSLGKLKEGTIVILITNPVDILTQMGEGVFGLPHGQVLGTGTLLDTARLHWRLGEVLQKPLEEITGYVMGEHGDSEFVAWSTVEGADKLSEEQKAKIQEETKQEAYEIIAGKGSTFFGIGAAAARVLHAVLNDTKEVFPVSVPLWGEYGVEGMALGVPAQLGRGGVEAVVELPLTKEELAALQASAQKLKTLAKKEA